MEISMKEDFSSFTSSYPTESPTHAKQTQSFNIENGDLDENSLTFELSPEVVEMFAKTEKKRLEKRKAEQREYSELQTQIKKKQRQKNLSDAQQEYQKTYEIIEMYGNGSGMKMIQSLESGLDSMFQRSMRSTKSVLWPTIPFNP